MDINISIGWEEIKFFLALVVVGAGYGWHCYRTGLRKGWDSSCYELFDSGYINIDPETLEVTRLTDREFQEFLRRQECYDEE